MTEQIQQLLVNTGWSLEDLLQNIQEFKKREEDEKTVSTSEDALQNSKTSVEDLIDSTVQTSNDSVEIEKRFQENGDDQEKNANNSDEPKKEENGNVNSQEANSISSDKDCIATEHGDEPSSSCDGLEELKKEETEGESGTTLVTKENEVVDLNDRDNIESKSISFEKTEDGSVDLQDDFFRIEKETSAINEVNELIAEKDSNNESSLVEVKESDVETKVEESQNPKNLGEEVKKIENQTKDYFDVRPGTSKDSFCFEESCSEKKATPSNSDVEGEASEAIEGTSEAIRNSVMEQLSSLRTRKKQRFIEKLTMEIDHETPKPKRACLEYLEAKPLSKVESSAVSVSSETNVSTSFLASNQIEIDPKEPLIEQTNELGLVILNIEGGVPDFTSPEEEPSPESENHAMALQVLRDIINKPKSSENRRSIEVEAKPSTSKEMCAIPSTSQEFPVPGTSKSESSPFVSNSLEEFLQGNSKLNVSYNIPKSGAEEGLTIDYRAASPVKINTGPQLQEKKEGKEQAEPKIKAKTLAEKRKMLENMKKGGVEGFPQHRDPDYAPKSNDPSKYKSKYKNKLKIATKPVSSPKPDPEEEIIIIQVDDKPPPSPPPIIADKTSYIVYKNKKIRVPSLYHNRMIAKISKRKKKYFSVQNDKVQKKPSLLTDLKKDEKVKLKPGPLSSKCTTAQPTWNFECRKLPQISLELQTGVGRAVPEDIVHLLPSSEDGVLTPDQIEFALTAVVPATKEESLSLFKYNVPYKNKEEQILVRKRKRVEVVDLTIDEEEEVSGPPESSETVAKAILDDLINYVEVKMISDSLIKTDESFIPDAKDDNSCSASASDLEAKKQRKKKRSRLDRELKGRLGCQIVELAIPKEQEENCTKSHCKLGCVCKSLQCEEIVPAHCKKISCMFDCTCPRNIISMEANSLNINNDTVSRLEHQAKRNLAKVEREFTQTLIHANDTSILVGHGSRSRSRRTTKLPAKFQDYRDLDMYEKDPVSSDLVDVNTKCSVECERVIVEGIIPLCLAHYKYNCSCKGTSPYTPPEILTKPFLPKEKETKESKPNNPPVLLKKVYKKKVIQFKEFINSKNKPSEKEITLQSLLEPQIDIHESPLFNFNFETLLMKQRNNFEEDSNYVPNKAIQRRKKIANKVLMSDTKSPVFEGEVIIDKSNVELLKKLGEKNEDGFRRLLPWEHLVKNYKLNKIRIWCMIDQPSRLLINLADKNPPSNYIDIAKAERKGDVTKWILNDKLPPEYDSTSLSFILRYNKGDYEICGVCTKKMNLGKTVIAVPIRNVEGQSSDPKFRKILPKPLGELKLENAAFTHTDLIGLKKILELKGQIFYALDMASLDDPKAATLSALLPDVTSLGGKWRMIYLNSDFTYLYFENSQYTIKYSDLVKFVDLAKTSKQTLSLRSDDLCKGYNHSSYGIYACSNFSDRIFIGPYFKNDNADLLTWRYVNKVLVDAEEFARLQKLNLDKRSEWRIQNKRKVVGKAKEADDSRRSLLKRKISEVEPDKGKKKLVLSAVPPPSAPVQVIQMSPKKPDEFNSFLITNIPYFGYLGAYKHENSNIIDVAWPFEDKVLRFPDCKHAKEFLIKRLSVLMQPIPEDFQIKIVILSNLDISKHKPLDVRCLTGQFICGEFGVLDAKVLSKSEAMEKTGYPREYIIKAFAKRAQNLINNKIRELANMLNLAYRGDTSEVAPILKKIEDYIRGLQAKQTELLQAKEQQTKLKTILEEKKRQESQKVFEMISNMPKHRRNAECAQFRKILNTTVPKEPELIEILDSDDEQPTDISKDKEQSITITPISNDAKTDTSSSSAYLLSTPELEITPVEPLVNEKQVSASSSAKSCIKIKTDIFNCNKKEAIRIDDALAPVEDIQNNTALQFAFPLSQYKLVKGSTSGKLLLLPKSSKKPNYKTQVVIRQSRIVSKNKL